MQLLKEIRACTLCSDVLPFQPKPILQMSRRSQLLIVGQAPGTLAHESGIPWNDASGVRLRTWLELSEDIFYDARSVAIVPMGFCYPGRGKSGDLPPRPECRTRWIDSVMASLHHIELTLAVGSYAANFFDPSKTLSHLIREHALSNSKLIVLPHPSPRNNIWLAKNKWFENECLPAIRNKLAHKVTLPKV